MSQWTHIAACFRFDGLRLSKDDAPDWDAVIGKAVLFESTTELWEEYDADPSRFMPCGSEGSLERVEWVNPDKSCAAAYAVAVFGDLRDFGTDEFEKRVIPWFERICLDPEVYVRQAVLSAEVEWCGRHILSYDREAEDVRHTCEKYRKGW